MVRGSKKVMCLECEPKGEGGQDKILVLGILESIMDGLLGMENGL